MMTTIHPESTAIGRASRVVLVEGEFDDPCAVCGVRPTSLVVEAWDEDLEALEKLGVSRLLARRAFCAEHEGAANALYQELASVSTAC